MLGRLVSQLYLQGYAMSEVTNLVNQPPSPPNSVSFPSLEATFGMANKHLLWLSKKPQQGRSGSNHQHHYRDQSRSSTAMNPKPR